MEGNNSGLSEEVPRDESRRFVIGIVDDDPTLAARLADGCPGVFGDQNQVLQATTVRDAAFLFKDAPGVEIVLVDGYIPDCPTDGLVAARLLRDAGYAGPIVAISSDDRVRRDMVRAVSNCAECSKDRPLALGHVVREMLKGR
jgi:DNA-binding response OmpR family regulator